MRLHIEQGGESTVLEVAVDGHDARVSDLAHAVGIRADPVFVDGRNVQPDEVLSDIGLVEGSRLSDSPTPSTADRLVVTGGPDAGACWQISDSLTIGRSSDADWMLENPSISARHVDVRHRDDDAVDITDLSSHNGTWVGSDEVVESRRVVAWVPIRLGSSTVEFRPADASDQPVGVGSTHADEGGRILFNRPPRPPVSVGPAVVTVPAAPPERTKPIFSFVALLAPIVMAVVMVAVLRRPQYAIFAMLSPLMLVGNYVSSRRRLKRDKTSDDVGHAEAMGRFLAELDESEAALRQLRRSTAPDLAEVARRVELPSNRLWERRSDSRDAMTVRLGVGGMQWDIPVDRSSRSAAADPPDVAEALADRSDVDDIELLGDLREGPIGVVGPHAEASSLTRSIIAQVATHHGPADVQIAVLTSNARLGQWSWVQWLPHARRPDGGVSVYAGDAATAFAIELSGQVDASDSSSVSLSSEPGWLLIVDDVALLHGRSSPTRRALSESGRGIYGVVVTETEDQLPSSVVTIAMVDGADGAFRRREPGTTRPDEVGVADLPSVSTVERIALAMARFEDPNLALPGGSVPVSVRPEDLWGEISVATVKARWAESKHRTALDATIGLGETAPLTIDFVADGPHGLIAGTTGAGKSELLRTLVVGLALEHDPDDLVFVLIDYKGGSAFDRCADLPHVVGLVTDLDDHLAERALTSLEAELHHRELVLRDAGATDIFEYRKGGAPREPLPRLMVVIDEFATLRSELPEFVAALVGIAQRGRSLGVHLVLATQRPSGAVDANIKANTNLRIALRVQDAADSTDVIDSKVAAELSRANPGRAFVRRGNADLTAVQTAYVSGQRLAVGLDSIRVASVPLGDGRPPFFPATEHELDETDLDLIVDAIGEAAIDNITPRRPWLDDVPAVVDPTTVGALASGDGAPVILAVGDEPAMQRHATFGWAPDDGHLLVFGALGSGVTSLLRSAIARLSAGIDGRPVWVLAADHGAGGLVGIEKWSHVACCLDPTDEERHERLLVVLEGLLDERRALSAVASDELPLVVVVVDGMAGFVEVTGTGAGDQKADILNRIIRDGPSVGIVLVAGANRSSEVPRSLLAGTRQKFVMELSDTNEYAALGIRSRTLPRFRPGRALLGKQPTVAQVINWEQAFTESTALAGPPPPQIELLAEDLDRGDLEPAVMAGSGIRIPYGLEDRTRTSAALTLRPGEHALIAGPSGSGCTTALVTIACQLRRLDPNLVLVAVTPTGTGALAELDVFDASGTAEDLDGVLRRATTDDRAWVVLVDDADRIEEATALEELARNSRPGQHIVAAARSTTTRSMYTHWTRHIRASGIGVILQPDNTVDGELLGVRLPRGERLKAVPGRGYGVAAGQVGVVQVAS
jgi:S-DNA-T family DNA segregation ATPase FtsK/SpoIIIE